MRIKLEPKWSEYLARLPEDGMGYQRVTLVLSSGRKLEDVPVFNAGEVDLPDQYAADEIEDVRKAR